MTKQHKYYWLLTWPSNHWCGIKGKLFCLKCFNPLLPLFKVNTLGYPYNKYFGHNVYLWVHIHTYVIEVNILNSWCRTKQWNKIPQQYQQYLYLMLFSAHIQFTILQGKSWSRSADMATFISYLYCNLDRAYYIDSPAQHSLA